MIHLTLCLVRHGETDWNVDGRIQGQRDIPLNARGLEQAKALAEALAEVPFDAIISSDLSRASITAWAVADRQQQTVEHWPTLRERTYGPFEGLTSEEFKRQDAESFQRFRARDPHFELFGGESLLALSERAQGILNTLHERFVGKTVLVVTHGGVIDALHRRVNQEPLEVPRTFPVENCAIHWLALENSHWKIVRWGDNEHLSLARDELPDA